MIPKVDFRPQKDEIFDFSKNRDFEPKPLSEVQIFQHPSAAHNPFDPRGLFSAFLVEGASASAEKILEFEGAKSSFQKGLGSKSRFLEKSKISYL